MQNDDRAALERSRSNERGKDSRFGILKHSQTERNILYVMYSCLLVSYDDHDTECYGGEKLSSISGIKEDRRLTLKEDRQGLWRHTTSILTTQQKSSLCIPKMTLLLLLISKRWLGPPTRQVQGLVSLGG